MTDKIKITVGSFEVTLHSIEQLILAETILGIELATKEERSIFNKFFPTRNDSKNTDDCCDSVNDNLCQNNKPGIYFV